MKGLFPKDTTVGAFQRLGIRCERLKRVFKKEFFFMIDNIGDLLIKLGDTFVLIFKMGRK